MGKESLNTTHTPGEGDEHNQTTQEPKLEITSSTPKKKQTPDKDRITATPMAGGLD